MHVKFPCLLAVAALASTDATAGTVAAASGPRAAGPSSYGDAACVSAPGMASALPSDSHARTLPVRAGLIMYGDPPAFRLSGIAKPKPVHGRTVPFRSGLIMYGDPPAFSSGIRPKLNLAGHGRIHHVTWFAADGSSVSTCIPAGVDLFDVDALIAPAGDWTDIRVELSDDLVLEGDINGAELYLELDLGAWDVALDEPVHSDGQVAVGLELTLPEDLLGEALNGHGLFVTPGDEGYDAVATAVRDGMIGVTR